MSFETPTFDVLDDDFRTGFLGSTVLFTTFGLGVEAGAAMAGEPTQTALVATMFFGGLTALLALRRDLRED